MEGWTWLLSQAGALQAGTQEDWDEIAEVEAWIEAGAPPVEPSPMPTRVGPVEVPSVALAVNQKQAAALLSCSVDHFQRHVC